MYAYCNNNPVNRSDPSGYKDYPANFIGPIQPGDRRGGVVEHPITFGAEISNTFSDLSPGYYFCVGLAALDGPLPFGDLAGASGAVVLSLVAIACAAYQYRNSLTVSMPKTEENEYSKSSNEILYNYWTADIVGGNVVPVKALSYSEAVIWAASENDLLCRNHSAAFAIVKFYPTAIWEAAHGDKQCGYLDHYHLSSAHKSHIWYYGD